jgi:hypothetical protein
MMNTHAPRLKKIIQESLIPNIKTNREYKRAYKNFVNVLKNKDPLSTKDLVYFLYFDLDDFEFRIETDAMITHNTLVCCRGSVYSKIRKKQDAFEVEELI